MRLIPALNRAEVCFEFEFILIVVMFLGEVRSSVCATKLYHVEVVGLWIDATHPLAFSQYSIQMPEHLPNEQSVIGSPTTATNDIALVSAEFKSFGCDRNPRSSSLGSGFLFKVLTVLMKTARNSVPGRNLILFKIQIRNKCDCAWEKPGQSLWYYFLGKGSQTFLTPWSSLLV